MTAAGFDSIVLGRHVDPVIRHHPIKDLARMYDLLGQLTLGNTGLRIGIRSIGRNIQIAAETFSIDHVMKDMRVTGA